MTKEIKEQDNIESDIQLAPLTHTISVYVNNKPGVLMRICQVFSRRGYNIESLVVSHGRKDKLSRMTIGIDGDQDGLQQIIKQINKLIDVIHCTEHNERDLVTEELALIKIKATPELFIDVSDAVKHTEGNIIDKSDSSIIVSVSGDSERVDWALRILSKFEIVETIRTGKVAMARSGIFT